MPEKACLFCAVPRDQVLVERPLTLAVRDSYPVSPGHSLIVPRRHVVTFFEASQEERLAMLKLLDEMKVRLDWEHKPDGYNIGINSGAAAGQTVMHLHIHLIPRYAGDMPDPRGGVRWILPDKAAYWEKK
jgi:diadenosine tetraphosphate (Ap4A) HIT family hydrolase